VEKSRNLETILSDSTLIAIMLEKAKTDHSLLTISLPNIQDDYLSVIIDIDEENGLLYLDELKPSQGNAFIERVKTFSASAKLQGVSIGFKSEFVKIHRKGALSSLCVKLPGSMQHRERRSSHRVPVAIGLEVFAKIVETGKEPIVLRVPDISAERIGLIANFQQIQRIMKATGDLLCTIRFPEEIEDWTVRIAGCHGYRQTDFANAQIGAHFLELTIKQKNILHQKLRFFDRENIRKGIPE
jgi:hypothetical protein